MTIKNLRDDLIIEICAILEGVYFRNYRSAQAKVRGYAQAIPLLPATIGEGGSDEVMPPEDLQDQIFPYFIVRTEAVEFPEEEDNPKVQTLLLFGIYDNDPKMRGYETLTTAMERVVARFREDSVMGSYWCDRKMELAFQDDDNYPYFFGGIDMTWNLPG